MKRETVYFSVNKFLCKEVKTDNYIDRSLSLGDGRAVCESYTLIGKRRAKNGFFLCLGIITDFNEHFY